MPLPNDTITIQDFQVHAKMKYHRIFLSIMKLKTGFTSWRIYLTGLTNLPFSIMIIMKDTALDVTIDHPGSRHDSDGFLPAAENRVKRFPVYCWTAQPINRSCKREGILQLQAINSLFTETNDQGEFTFINVPPSTYANFKATSLDTDLCELCGK